jgi:phosphotransferase system HPr (HPr) family protein
MSYSLQETVTLKNKLGLHARAAAVFVQVADKYKSHIKLKKPNNSEWVNGKSILSVMTLDASQGSQIIINVEGPDAQEALNRLIKLINDKFGEKE